MPASPKCPIARSERAGGSLLAIASLRGAHLQSAQSAYQRACMGLTPAEIEQAKSFAQSWRPSPRTGAHCWIRKRVPREQVRDQELVRSANRHSHPDRPGPGGVRDGPRVSLTSTGERSDLFPRHGDGPWLARVPRNHVVAKRAVKPYPTPSMNCYKLNLTFPLTTKRMI